MNCPKVSIICPVYKAEKYIHRCLDSIQQQTLTDWECILVDDGSPDTSGAICDEYAAKDSRFKVIHKQNGGVAMARQTGVDVATGEYLIHTDPDDYIELDMLEEMHREIVKQDVDILITDYFKNDTSTNSKRILQSFMGATSRELSDSILQQKLHGSLWNKLVRRESIIKARPNFYKGINYSEDVLIWVQMARFDFSVGYLPKAYYHYVSNENSITAKLTISGYEMRKKYIEKLAQLGVSKAYINSIALKVKTYAMRDGIMSRCEYYRYIPTKWHSIKELDWFPYKTFAVLAYFRLYWCGIVCFRILYDLAIVKGRILNSNK